MRTTGHRFHLQEEAIAQFFGSVFVTSNGGRDMKGGRLE